jgi:hypothetical protein
MPKELVVQLGNLGKEEWVKPEARDMETFGHRISASPIRGYYYVCYRSGSVTLSHSETLCTRSPPQSFNTCPQKSCRGRFYFERDEKRSKISQFA